MTKSEILDAYKKNQKETFEESQKILSFICSGDLDNFKKMYKENKILRKKPSSFFFEYAVSCGRENVAAYLAEETEDFSPPELCEILEKAIEHDIKQVFVSAFNGKSKGRGIDGYVLEYAAAFDRREIAFIIAAGMTGEDFADVEVRNALAVCADKGRGWLSVIKMAERNGFHDDNIMEMAVQNALDDEVVRTTFDELFFGLEEKVMEKGISEIEEYMAFVGCELKEKLASGAGSVYQKQLDKMLVLTRSEGLFDSDLAGSVDEMRTLLIQMGAQEPEDEAGVSVAAAPGNLPENSL